MAISIKKVLVWIYYFFSTIGVFALIILIVLIANERIKWNEYEYDYSHNSFIEYHILSEIKERHQGIVLDFENIEIQHLSGKTFKVTGKIILEGVLTNKISKNFECVATGWMWETNPAGNYSINLYYQK